MLDFPQQCTEECYFMSHVVSRYRSDNGRFSRALAHPGGDELRLQTQPYVQKLKAPQSEKGVSVALNSGFKS